MAMKNMALSKAEAQEMAQSAVPKAEEYDDELPKYPYGLTLYLNDEVMKKLGMKELPAVGSKMWLQAAVTVTGVSAHQYQGGEASQCLDIQITDMDLAKGGGDSQAKAAMKLYPEEA